MLKTDDAVKYVPYCCGSLRDLWEYGVVTSRNDKYVFVRFKGDSHSKACDPSTLEDVEAPTGERT